MGITAATNPGLRYLLACLLVVWNHRPGVVDAANVFDWTPSISLSDNFGVAEGLCPDIAGFGANLNCDTVMQLHTCKRQGDDTQFVYDFTTKAIRSVNYDPSCQSTSGAAEDGACVTIDGTIAAGANLRLDSCDGGMDQSFEVYVDGKIKSASDPELCLAKTSDVGPAGPNERTDFALAECDSADPLDVTWTVSAPILPDSASSTKLDDLLGMDDAVDDVVIDDEDFLMDNETMYNETMY